MLTREHPEPPGLIEIIPFHGRIDFRSVAFDAAG